jgi:hypothetical protein
MSPPNDPPPNAQPLLAQPLVFELRLTKPSGAAIADADVEIQWDDDASRFHQLPQTQKTKTNGTGKAQVPVLDPANWLAPDKANGTTGTIRVSKAHHGPVVPYGTAFANGPASARLRYKPGAAAGQGTLSIDGLTPTQEVLWGRPRVIGPTQNILHMMLVEGGELGREHPTVRTRRLSAPHRPETPAQPVSQIDEELLFHIAHGGLALDPNSDFKFKIVQETQPDGTVKDVLKFDLPAAPTGSPPTVPKLRIRNAVAGGVRIMHILEFRPGRNPAGYDLSGLADTHSLNPRLVVGTVRLCRMLAGLGVRTMITVGFGRAGETRFHGTGRAVDFSGAIMAHVIPLKDPENPANTDLTDPHVSAKIKPPWENVSTQAKNPNTGQMETVTVTGFKRDCIAEQDLIIEYHWGSVQLLVDTGSGVVRRNEDHNVYQNPRAPTAPEKLLYRLSTLPASNERGSRHVLTDAHYTLAGRVFLAIYQFFANEFSHGDGLLGPIANRAAAGGVTAALLRQAGLDDTNAPGATSIEPGTTGGFLLHPDNPEPDVIGTNTGKRREAHRNHIHANVGNAGSTSNPNPPDIEL